MQYLQVTLYRKTLLLWAQQALSAIVRSVVSQHPDLYNVVGVTGFSRLDKLLSICQQFKSQLILCCQRKETAFAQMLSEAHLNCKILIGEQVWLSLPLAESGHGGLRLSSVLAATLAAANRNKTILLANKNVKVMAGRL